jgi:hypothetical protein
MAHRNNLFGKLKDKAFGAADKVVVKVEKIINSTANEDELSEREKNDRERTLLQIKSGQYFLLGVATIALLVRDDSRLGIALAFGALFFEKVAAALIEHKFMNADLSGYISANYSNLTRLSDVFNPVIYAISDDCKNLNNLVINVRAHR